MTSPSRTVFLVALLVGAVAALMLAPAAFASESALSVYGGPSQELVNVQAGGGGGGGAPLPSTGLALGVLAVTAMVLVGVGAGARRLRDHPS